MSQALNHSFGTEGPGFQHVNGMNVKLELIDSGLIKAHCIMTVTYRSDQMMRERNRKHREEAVAMIKGALDRFKDDYESRFDETLKFEMEEKALEESTEFIHVSQYTALSRAFFRVKTLIRVK